MKKARVYKRLPKGYNLYDPCRSLKQARWMHRQYRGLKAKGGKSAIIVETGATRGKNKVVFPYHIAVRGGKLF